MKLEGVVTTGLGDCARWIALHAEAYAEKTGMQLFPGTLNVLLPAPFVLPEDCLRLEKADYGGQASVSLVPCFIEGRPVVILRTDANDDGSGPHPRELIEVAAATKLPETLGLGDGDPVTIEVPGP